MARYCYPFLFVFCFCISFNGEGQLNSNTNTSSNNALSFIPSANKTSVEETSRPWVIWYWMQASVSQVGITKDLEAMKSAGIGGAFLMSIKGAANPPHIDPPIEQLSPAWWEMVRYAFKEADRLGLKIAMHVSDGFAVAGGPWITAENSMQKIVWTETHVDGKRNNNNKILLQRPTANENFYRDVAVLAFPTPKDFTASTQNVIPKITTNKLNEDATFLIRKNNKENFRSDDPCWIQYEFSQPFVCRTIIIRTNGNNYQAHRLIVEGSDDGKVFRDIGRLQPPRHGWQDNEVDASVTHAIVPTMARFFRFRYDKTGSEPGAEDLDAAKWKATLKVSGIELSSMPKLHQYEGKTGSVWRISPRTTIEQIPGELCIPKEHVMDITTYVDSTGHLTWKVPPGHWTILRMGHTSTGFTNYTAGAGKGLECDKFNPGAVQLQFDNWFGEAVKKVGPSLAASVLKGFHIDSWECGSQNWSTVFPNEFKKRRGYDLMPYLLTMAGYPVQSADVSERFLYDVRQTITDLVHDNFYGTLKKLAHEQGCIFTAESVAPTMTGDGMLHYDAVDIPMGEFWFRSPTHDKPNDMLDAISGAHVYGKQLVQAEAFTELRMAWDEHPALLKTLGDRNYALGINRFAYHVFTHNPWVDRKPGMTLDGVGLYFQRDQTWWKPGRAWVEYAQRCQTLLQQGVPVVDLAVFTGEEIPRRAILPDRLTTTLPGIFGKETIERERKRLANVGEPLRDLPLGVKHSANIADPVDWIDPLHGYCYDSFNKDALLRLAKVNNGRIELPGGISYALLIIPASHSMSPQANLMSPEVAMKLQQLINDGATVLFAETPSHVPGLTGFPSSDDTLKQINKKLFDGNFSTNKDNVNINSIGNGRVVKGPYEAESFYSLGITRDVVIYDSVKKITPGIAWTHRKTEEEDIYFFSNQSNVQRNIIVSVRNKDKEPIFYDPVSDDRWNAADWTVENERTTFPIKLEANGSLFVILRPLEKSSAPNKNKRNSGSIKNIQTLVGTWTVGFDPSFGGPISPVKFETLTDWTQHAEFGIRHYSGTALYSKSFLWNDKKKIYSRVWLDVGRVENIAEVIVNGMSCGVAWTAPYRVEITKALKNGENKIIIEVTNTWANRLIGDQSLPEAQRITKTTAPYRLTGKSLLPAGLLGPVQIIGTND